MWVALSAWQSSSSGHAMAPSGCLWDGAGYMPRIAELPDPRTGTSPRAPANPRSGLKPRPSRNWPSPEPSSPRFHAPDGSALPRPTPTTHPPSIGRRRPQRSVSSDRPRDRDLVGVAVGGTPNHPPQVVHAADEHSRRGRASDGPARLRFTCSPRRARTPTVSSTVPDRRVTVWHK